MSKKEMTTEKRLKVRLYLSLLVYTVVGYGLTLILDYIFSKFDNGIFAWLYRRLDLLFILYLMIGFVCIFNYYWKKPWGYLDEVIDATQTVYEQNNHTVSLSDPLKEFADLYCSSSHAAFCLCGDGSNMALYHISICRNWYAEQFPLSACRFQLSEYRWNEFLDTACYFAFGRN